MISHFTLTCRRSRPRLALLLAGVIGSTGCCGMVLPSSRWAPEPSPVGSEVDVPVAALGVSHHPGCGHVACGDCGDARRGPVLACRRGGGRLPCRGFPHASCEPGTGPASESLIDPPHSRFHPVPTAPVFAGRIEYDPPRAMVPAHPKRRAVTAPLGATPSLSSSPSGSPILGDPVRDTLESAPQTRAVPGIEGALVPPGSAEQTVEPGRTGEIRSVLRRR